MTVLRGGWTWLSAAQSLRFSLLLPMARQGSDGFDTMHGEPRRTDDVWDALEAHWRPMARRVALAECTLFVLPMGHAPGLRLAERARATVGDLRRTARAHGGGGSGGGLWRLSVLGKGSRRRELELASSPMRCIEARRSGRVRHAPSARAQAGPGATDGGMTAKDKMQASP